MRTNRGVLRLLDDAGRTLAEIVTDHVSAGPADGPAAASWTEIEVELVTGDRELLKAVGARLSAAGARPAGTATKLERALGELPAARRSAGDGGGAEAAEASPLTPHSPAGEVVLAYVRQQALDISRLDPFVRRDEPDAVHQMRVSVCSMTWTCSLPIRR